MLTRVPSSEEGAVVGLGFRVYVGFRVLGDLGPHHQGAGDGAQDQLA